MEGASLRRTKVGGPRSVAMFNAFKQTIAPKKTAVESVSTTPRLLRIKKGFEKRQQVFPTRNVLGFGVVHWHCYLALVPAQKWNLK